MKLAGGGAPTRTMRQRKAKVMRLSKKTKPWVAAASGIFSVQVGEPPMDHEDEDDVFYDVEEEDPFFDTQDEPWGSMDINGEDVRTAEQEVAPVVIIIQIQRDQIAVNREKAMGEKRKRDAQVAQNRLKAESTKRRKAEIEDERRRQEFHEFRRLNDPFYTDSEEEDWMTPDNVAVDNVRRADVDERMSQEVG